jgi:hypothetical protein
LDGWTLIDEALDIVGVDRMGKRGLLKETVDEIPPDEFEGG